ncbi:hypothetical protein [Marinicellulosiphila megalodicopiae]|uniref:hypothetical protein n=1 Tax=Marinicellulosiphila megalodicopiae TaxID=2724896 RepID=UPI003BB1A23C
MGQFKLPALCVAITAASLLTVSCEEDTQSLKVEIDSNIAPINQEIKAMTDLNQGMNNLSSGIAAPAANVTTNLDSAVSIMSSMSIMGSFFGSDEEFDDDTSSMNNESNSIMSRALNSAVSAKAANDSMEDTINGLFDVANATADLSTNTISVGVNTDNLCDTGDTDCLTVLDNVVLQIQVINNVAGIITVTYSGYEPFEFSYAPDYLAMLVDLGELKAAGLAIDTELGTDNFSEVPATFDGQFAISVAASADQATVMSWIPQMIQIGDSTNVISVDATSNLSTFALDAVLETIQITSSMNAIIGQFTGDSGEDVSINFGGANFDLLIDGINETATITNSNLAGLSFSLDGDVLLSAMVANFSAQYTESDETISLTTAFDAMLEFTDVFLSDETDDGTTVTYVESTANVDFNLDMTSGTQLTSVNDELTVQAGSVTLDGQIIVTEECEQTWPINDEYDVTYHPCTSGGPTTTVSETFMAGEVIAID